ncbi:MAG: hypothetical protein C0505_10985 [Leptothrix sp. (in: Bacteria)]|nr:hypothetical protein [Leptothrix sp. (in: b-proteobacteria)]
MPTPIDSRRLVGTWWRVPEEDEPGTAVYRRDGVPLPPARGRRGFTLQPDGGAKVLGPGPTDRRESTASRWQLDAQGQLHVEGVPEAASAPVTLSGDRLTLKR